MEEVGESILERISRNELGGSSGGEQVWNDLWEYGELLKVGETRVYKPRLGCVRRGYRDVDLRAHLAE